MLDFNEYLLTLLAEECNEVAQRASKAIRFGIREVQKEPWDKPEQNPDRADNSERLARELDDLFAVCELLMSTGVLVRPSNEAAIKEKQKKILKYASYSRKLGTLEPL